MEKIILNSLQGAARNVVYYVGSQNAPSLSLHTLSEPCDYLIIVNGGLVYTTANGNQQGVKLNNESFLLLHTANSNLALPTFWIIRGPNGLKIQQFALGNGTRVAAYWL